MFCAYYQAQIERNKTWFFVATLRANEHLAFDRTLDKTKNLFEIFVPEERSQEFEALMAWYLHEGIALSLVRLPNRLAAPEATLISEC